MNLFKIVFLACVLVVTANPLSKEEKQAMYGEVLTKCKAQESASDADVQELISHQPLSSRSGRCLNACIMEYIGFIKDGKLSVEGSIKAAEMTGDPARVKNVELVGIECASIVEADRCDLAVQIMQCVAKVAVANGLDPEKDLMM